MNIKLESTQLIVPAYDSLGFEAITVWIHCFFAASCGHFTISANEPIRADFHHKTRDKNVIHELSGLGCQKKYLGLPECKSFGRLLLV
jgi:hypothetical protein